MADLEDLKSSLNLTSAFSSPSKVKPFSIDSLTKYGSMDAPSSPSYVPKFDVMDAYRKNKPASTDLNISKDTPWYLDGDTMQGYSALLGAGVGLADYLQNRKTVDLQQKGLKQNIAQQNTDNEFRATARANLNRTVTG